MCFHRTALVVGVVVCLTSAGIPFPSYAQSLGSEPNLTEEQKKEFLLYAKVVKSRPIGKGVTNPSRLTLNDGTMTHDAAFQPVDRREDSVNFIGGPSEIAFRDSYHYNIAGYELAKLLGLDDMVPVTVERKWQGHKGALSWWVSWKWDEEMRRKQGLNPPDVEAWNKQVDKVRVFGKLICNTDLNPGNLLITEDWKLWMIDFTRAFRLHKQVQNPEQLQRCDRQLLEKLRQLDGKVLLEKTQPHLSSEEVQALMSRRHQIVDYFQQLIARKGEDEVLY
jgi:hypothetical protein